MLENMRENAEQAIDLLKLGILKSDKKTIINAYRIVEQDYFSWDDLIEEFKIWDALTDISNDII